MPKPPKPTSDLADRVYSGQKCLANRISNEDAMTIAELENVIRDVLPDTADKGKLVSQITTNFKQRVSNLDLDNDGVVSTVEFELSLRDKKEAFERGIIKRFVEYLGFVLVFPLLVAVLVPDVRLVFDSIMPLLIAISGGMITAIGAYLGMKAWMNRDVTDPSLSSFEPPITNSLSKQPLTKPQPTLTDDNELGLNGRE